MKTLLSLLLFLPFFVLSQKVKRSSTSTGTIVPTAPVSRSARIETFKLSTDADWLNAWNKAKASVDTIIFGAGTYSINTATNGAGWYLERDNLTLIGAGMDKTVLTAGPAVGATMSNQTRLVVPFVRGYMISDSAYTYTYKNTTHKGDAFIILKNRKWVDAINAGSKMMMVGGSHYFDQEFGELVTVIKKGNDTLYLKDPLSGAYSVDSVPYACITLHDYEMPAIGKTVKIETNIFYKTTIGRLISVGDNIFSVNAIDTAFKTMTLLNIGKGNSPAGTVIPIGTTVTKGRILAPWDHTKNLKIQNLTIKGQQDRVLRLDNTYGAVLTNVKVTRASAIANGFNYTIDFCRDIKMVNCQFISLIGTCGSQVSRSSGDITFSKCTFTNVGTDCSEYSYNLTFDSCIFNVKGNRTFILGNTVRKSWVTNNTFNIDSTWGVIQGNEIQSLVRIQREYALIKNNTFNIINYCISLLDLPIYGRSDFIGNKVTGGSMDNLSGSLNRAENGSNFYPTDNRIEGNTIETKFNRWFNYGGVYAGVFNNNQVTNTSGTPVAIFVGWTKLKSATVSNNDFKGFKSPIVAPVGVTLLNNTIQ